MSTARKYTSNQRSMSPASRKKAYAAINITWANLRPDLKWEAKEEVRQQLLEWIIRLLGLKKLDSIKDLSDGQIGKALEEMKRLSGKNNSIENPQSAIPNPKSNDNIVYLSAFRASEEQKYTLGKILDYIGWSEEAKTRFLEKRGFPSDINLLPFKKANSLTIILLNIAADKDLRAQGEAKITRQMTAKYIPVLKKKLGVDQ